LEEFGFWSWYFQTGQLAAVVELMKTGFNFLALVADICYC
jgi:hypothetical protein